MTVVIPGHAPGHVRHECYECRCVFDFSERDATRIFNDKAPLAKANTTTCHAQVKCPECDAECNVYIGRRHDKKTDAWPTKNKK